MTHRRVGRAFVFRAHVAIEEARRRALRHLVARLFNDSPGVFLERLFSDGFFAPIDVAPLARRLEGLGAIA